MGNSIDELAEFRSMFDIGSDTHASARRVAHGRDVFMGGPLSKGYEPEDVETI